MGGEVLPWLVGVADAVWLGHVISLGLVFLISFVLVLDTGIPHREQPRPTHSQTRKYSTGRITCGAIPYSAMRTTRRDKVVEATVGRGDLRGHPAPQWDGNSHHEGDSGGRRMCAISKETVRTDFQISDWWWAFRICGAAFIHHVISGAYEDALEIVTVYYLEKKLLDKSK